MLGFALLILSSVSGSVFPATPDDSRPIAWPSGLLEARIAFAEPIDDAVTNGLVGRSIAFGAGSDEEGESGTIGAILIAGLRVEDEGRTVVLLTDPHPMEATYRIEADGPIGAIGYDLIGVEASWTADGDREPSWVGWLPELDLDASREAVADSVSHGVLFERLKEPGTLQLRSLIALPEGESTVSLRSDRSFEAELMFEPIEVGDDHRAEHAIDSFGEPAELFVLLPTGPDSGEGMPRFAVEVATEETPEPEPLGRSRQILPWAPEPIRAEGEIPPLPEELQAGDPARGRTVFFSEQANCAACHRIGDEGGAIGPDLSGIGSEHTLAEIYREIEAPSAEIDPDYRPYTVAMDDGRVFVGLVRAEGPDLIEIVGSDAEPVRVERSEIEEIGPVSTSIMPVGLAGAIGQEDLRDLLAFLGECRED